LRTVRHTKATASRRYSSSMRAHITYYTMLAPFILLASAPLGALAGDVLQTNGYSNCQDNSDITVNKLDIKFDRNTKKIKFDIAGVSKKSQKVMATLIVNAYGKEIYKNEFNPCDDATKVDELCPGRSPAFSTTSNLKLTSRSSRRLFRCSRRAEHPS